MTDINFCDTQTGLILANLTMTCILAGFSMYTRYKASTENSAILKALEKNTATAAGVNNNDGEDEVITALPTMSVPESDNQRLTWVDNTSIRNTVEGRLS